MTQSIQEHRKAIVADIFGKQIPLLWCPTLTHYNENGRIDEQRMASHLAYLTPHVKGVLVPGSTGDGWEMNEAQHAQVLQFTLDKAVEHGLHVLVGVLKTEAGVARQYMVDVMATLRDRSSAEEDLSILKQSGVCGFTVCPPRGRDLSSDEIRASLLEILELQWPVALYQLPQITENEMASSMLAQLSEQYANFLYFKDSSGEDKVAKSGDLGGGVFLVRGAEGQYAQSLIAAGGNYQGLLLSTANVFPVELSAIIDDIKSGNVEQALTMSDRLSSLVDSVFELVADVEAGNAFTNANKAMDHYMAHGPSAGNITPPRLHAGCNLSVSVIQSTGQLLSDSNLMPQQGYLTE